MRIICPTCNSQYEVVREAILPDGQDVQCSNCQTVWHQTRDSEAGEPVSAVESAPAHVEEAVDEKPWSVAVEETPVKEEPQIETPVETPVIVAKTAEERMRPNVPMTQPDTRMRSTYTQPSDDTGWLSLATEDPMAVVDEFNYVEDSELNDEKEDWDGIGTLIEEPAGEPEETPDSTTEQSNIDLIKESPEVGDDLSIFDLTHPSEAAQIQPDEIPEEQKEPEPWHEHNPAELLKEADIWDGTEVKGSTEDDSMLPGQETSAAYSTENSDIPGMLSSADTAVETLEVEVAQEHGTILTDGANASFDPAADSSQPSSSLDFPEEADPSTMVLEEILETPPAAEEPAPIPDTPVVPEMPPIQAAPEIPTIPPAATTAIDDPEDKPWKAPEEAEDNLEDFVWQDHEDKPIEKPAAMDVQETISDDDLGLGDLTAVLAEIDESTAREERQAAANPLGGQAEDNVLQMDAIDPPAANGDNKHDALLAALRGQIDKEDHTPPSAPPAPISIGNVPDEIIGKRSRAPSMDDVRSSLRDDLGKIEAGSKQGGRRGGFSIGFIAALLLFGLGAGVYMQPALIKNYLPVAAPYLDSYVASVDSMRLKVETIADDGIAAISGNSG